MTDDHDNGWLARFGEGLVRIATSYPRAMLGIHLLAFALLAAWMATSFSWWSATPRPLHLFDNSIETLLGDEAPSVRTFRRFEQRFRPGEFMELVISLDGPPDAATLQRLSDFVAELEAREDDFEVLWIGRLPHAPRALKLNRTPAPAELAAFLQRVIRDPVATRLARVRGSGWDLALLVQMPALGRDDARRGELYKRLKSTWSEFDPGWSSAIIGLPAVRGALRDAVRDALGIYFPINNLLVVLISLFVFRRFGRVALALVPMLQAEALTTFIFLSNGKSFNYITANIGTVLLVLGIATNLHLISRYIKEREHNDDRRIAFRRAARIVAKPCIVANLTTMLALLSFVLADKLAVRDFGLYSAGGLLLVVLSSFTLLPALTVLFDRGPGGARGLRMPNLHRLPRWAWAHPKTVLAGAAILSIAGAAGTSALRVGSNIHLHFSKNSPVRQAAEFATERFPGFVPFEIQVTWPGQSAGTTLETLARIDSIEAAIADQVEIAGQKMTTGEILSAPDLVASYCLNPAKGQQCPAGQPTEQTAAALLRAAARSGAAPYLRRDDEGVTARLTVFRDPGYAADGLALRDALADTVAQLAGPDATVVVTGLAAIWAEHETSIARELLQSFGIAAIVVLALMAWVYGHVRPFLISLLPNAVPLLLTLGLAGFISLIDGGQLSSAALMYTTVAVGIIVDATLFFLLTYGRCLRERPDGAWALTQTVDRVGAGIVLTGVCLTLGFAILMFSSLTPVRVFGGLLSATVFVALLADLLILPALCRLFWNPQPQTHD